MQLATCDDTQPWLCNVWFVSDEEDRIYWISRETRHHSLHIEKNSKVACSFHKNYNQGLGHEPAQSVVMSGEARRVPAQECEKPYLLYNTRYPNLEPFQSLNSFLKDKGDHFFYELAPTKIVWWDEINFPEQSRQEIHI